MPRCGHCKRLAPEYESAATRLKGIVPLVKVSAASRAGTGLLLRRPDVSLMPWSPEIIWKPVLVGPHRAAGVQRVCEGSPLPGNRPARSWVRLRASTVLHVPAEASWLGAFFSATKLVEFSLIRVSLFFYDKVVWTQHHGLLVRSACFLQVLYELSDL